MRMMPPPFLCRLLVSLVACLLIAPPAAAADDVSEKEIQAAFASPDSHARHSVWKRLNPEKDTHYRFLVRILQTLSWHDRQGAVLALTKAATDEVLAKMVKDLKSHKDPAVRQGMADALAKMNDEKFYPHLYEGLKDKSPMVRRMVVHYLRVHKKKDAVEALVTAFQKEEDPVVRSLMVESLNSLTQAFQGPDPIAWMTWWLSAKADPGYELGKVDDEAKKKAEELGTKLKQRSTVSIGGGVTLDTEERGKMNSMPILIIPYYGYSKEIMKPFLAELEKTNKLFYIQLPSINTFKDVPVKTDRKVPEYPIDKLVAAFEDLRKETKQERFALMACGMNAWIAMRYATLYPKSVSHMVLICPLTGGDGYGRATSRMENEGRGKNDIELWHLALNRRMDSKTGESTHDIFHREKKLPKPDGEDGSIDRREFSLYFKDERDSLISMLYPMKDDRSAIGVAIPDFKCFMEAKRNIPTIVIVGKNCLYTSVDDCKAIAKHYGGQCYVYENSSGMPFAEESPLFNKHMAFLLREARSKDKAKDKAKEKEKTKGKAKEKEDGKPGKPETAGPASGKEKPEGS